MTLILALTASDGIVLASDGQITHGMVRSTGKKIRASPFFSHALASGARSTTSRPLNNTASIV